MIDKYIVHDPNECGEEQGFNTLPEAKKHCEDAIDS